MSLLSILSGTDAEGYDRRMAQQAALEEKRNKTLFDIMAEGRKAKSIQGIYGEKGRPETMLAPPGIDSGLQGPEVPGSGMGSVDPFQRELAQAQLTGLDKSFAPSYTAQMAVPADIAMQGLKGTQAMEKQQQGRLGDIVNYNTRDDSGTSVQVAGKITGFRDDGQPIIKELGESDKFGARYQSASSTEQDKIDIAYYEGLQTNADKKADTAVNYDYINRIADAAGIETGFGDQALLMGQKIAGRMGITGWEDEAGAREAVLQQYNSATLDLMKPGEDGKRALSGQSSDKELEFFKQIPPGLGKTKAGRELIALAAREDARRSAEVSKRSLPYRRKGVPSYEFREMIREELYAKQPLDPKWRQLLDAHNATVGVSEGLAMGTVEEGYRYIGGEPSEETSWVKVD